MFWFRLILLVICAALAKKSYDEYRIELAMVWAVLSGWNLNALISTL